MAEHLVPISERVLLSIPSAAALVDQSEGVVHTWIKAGVLPTVKVGRRRLIRRSDLDAWVAQLGSEAA